MSDHELRNRYLNYRISHMGDVYGFVQLVNDNGNLDKDVLDVISRRVEENCKADTRITFRQMVTSRYNEATRSFAPSSAGKTPVRVRFSELQFLDKRIEYRGHFLRDVHSCSIPKDKVRKSDELFSIVLTSAYSFQFEPMEDVERAIDLSQREYRDRLDMIRDEVYAKCIEEYRTHLEKGYRLVSFPVSSLHREGHHLVHELRRDEIVKDFNEVDRTGYQNSRVWNMLRGRTRKLKIPEDIYESYCHSIRGLWGERCSDVMKNLKNDASTAIRIDLHDHEGFFMDDRSLMSCRVHGDMSVSDIDFFPWWGSRYGVDSSVKLTDGELVEMRSVVDHLAPARDDGYSDRREMHRRACSLLKRLEEHGGCMPCLQGSDLVDDPSVPVGYARYDEIHYFLEDFSHFSDFDNCMSRTVETHEARLLVRGNRIEHEVDSERYASRVYHVKPEKIHIAVLLIESYFSSDMYNKRQNTALLDRVLHDAELTCHPSYRNPEFQINLMPGDPLCQI